MSFIDAGKIHYYLDTKYDANRIEAIINKAFELKGLDSDEIMALLNLEDTDSLQKLFSSAIGIKEKIYGEKINFFAPIKISDYCDNNCIYCRYKNSNTELQRRVLTLDEILKEVQKAVDKGTKRILLIAGEDFKMVSLDYLKAIVDTVWTNYKIKADLNIAPLSVEQFREVSSWDIGTYHISQESYHQAAYRRMHVSGPKADYNNRLNTLDRAIQGGIKDFGIGVVFGLYDWRFEVLALIEHARYLSNKYAIEPKTISIPRMESQEGSILSKVPPYQVLDWQFKKIISALRLALPHTEILLPANEKPNVVKAALEFGLTTNIYNIDISDNKMLSLQNDNMLEKV